MKNFKPSFWYILKCRLQGKYFLYEFYFKGKKTLDLGCGEGEFLKFDKENIVGVEVNERVVNRLKAEGFRVEWASAEKLPFGDSSFEAVHCHNVIEHLEASVAHRLLMEAARVLQSGGLFILSSELVTKRFWQTFGHVKPYPPEAVIKLLRPDSREEFEGIGDLRFSGLFYFGQHYRNRFIYLISVFLAYYLPVSRREYFLVLRKKEIY